MADDKEYITLFGEGAYEIDYNTIDCDLLTDIARSLLNKHRLIDGDRKYRICEIEFYVKTEGHPDHYVHCSPDQATHGKWYFHRTKAGNYKGGTYKGLDLTFGKEDEDNPIYFSVLIRSLYSEDDDTMTEGPCKIVNMILANHDCKDVNEYMEGRADPLSARSTKNFHIKRCKGLKKYDIWCGARIGLSEKYEDYQYKMYRYVIMKDRISKKKRSLEFLE